jgi:hypothetical protein
MLGQYANREEVWEPISDWGRSFRAYLDSQKQSAKPAKMVKVSKAVKASRAAKARLRKASKACNKLTCSLCLGMIYPWNKTGLCKTCGTKARRSAIELGPRPVCNSLGCTAKIIRNSKYGLCKDHSASMRQVEYQRRRAAARRVAA